jgi:hypothetical protein
MEPDASAIVAIVAAFISVLFGIFALFQAVRTKRLNLFSSFNLTKELSIANPGLLYSVHNLPHDPDDDDAKAAAYLSIILDAFQHYHISPFTGRFKRMVRKMKKKPAYLNVLLANQYNQDLWKTVKVTYYGKFDSRFIAAIDQLIEHEKTKTA